MLLVLSAVDDETGAAHEEATGQRLPGCTVLREHRPGLSHARNRALAACDDEDVIAFLDDDSIAPPGWLPSMHEAWERAAARTACLGGPIRPRFEPPGRPSWLTDALLPVVTALDHGPEPLDLDPNVTTVYGANVSFRCGPLRAVGGFDPGLGHRGARTGFGEEDAAERALHRSGWGVRYDPAPWVEHVIAPERLRRPAFLRRRMRYGAVLGAERRRSPGLAARQLATSALGAPLAALRGDQARAMERATRVAENAGVLLGPVLARR